MARCHPLVCALALALPVAVEVPAPGRDSSETRVTLAGGSGSYALIARGCDDQVLSADRVRFRDVGAAIEHKTASPLILGLRAGILAEDASGRGTQSNAYVNPNVSLESRYFSIGAGYFRAGGGIPFEEQSPLAIEWPNPSATGHVRIGSLSSFYLSGELLEGVPIYSGGSFIGIGVGGRLGSNVSAWGGLGVGPYDGPGLALRSEIRISPRLSAQLRTRIGSSEGIGENSAALGLTYRLPWRTAAPRVVESADTTAR